MKAALVASTCPRSPAPPLSSRFTPLSRGRGSATLPLPRSSLTGQQRGAAAASAGSMEPLHLPASSSSGLDLVAPPQQQGRGAPVQGAAAAASSPAAAGFRTPAASLPALHPHLPLSHLLSSSSHSSPLHLPARLRQPVIYTYEEFEQLTSVHINCTDDLFLASG